MDFTGLVINGRDLDRDLAAGLLRPYLRIERETAGIVPLAPWLALPNEARILLYLVARRAMAALGLPVAVVAAPKEIAEATGIPGGSVRPALKRLTRLRLIARTPRGPWRYTVANTQLARVAAEINQYWVDDPAFALGRQIRSAYSETREEPSTAAGGSRDG